MIDNELLEIDRSFNSYKGTIVIPRLCENNCVLFLCFNSYKGTIVMEKVNLRYLNHGLASIPIKEQLLCIGE